MLERILDQAKRRGASAELFITERFESEVFIEAGNLKNAERKRRIGIGLRVIDNGRIGFAASSDESRGDELLNRAISSARFGKEAKFSFPGNTAGTNVNTFDPAIESFDPDAAAKEGMRAVDAIRVECPEGLTDVSLSSTSATFRLLNTEGLDICWKGTEFSHWVTTVIVEGDSILWVTDGGSYGILDIRTDEYVRSIADLVRKSRVKAPRVSGEMPVFFAAREMPNLLQAIEMGVNGRRLVKGDSPLAGREGEKILGHVTLVDDPLIAGAPGSRPCDHEGTPSKRNPLFENGVFRSFLFDLDTASKSGHKPTGNAIREGLFAPPSSGITNLVMSPGTMDADDCIAGMREGVAVYGVLGGGQSNLLAGDFALNVMLGFYIRDGEFCGRVTDTMVSGNIYQEFSNCAPCSVVKPSGAVFAPDVLFDRLSVSGR